MSIDNIQLTPAICQLFYANKMIEKKPSIEKVVKQKTVEIASLGKNEERVIFLVNNEMYKFLSIEEMDVLTKLILACKMTMNDIALINFHQSNNISSETLVNQFKAKKILVFGINPEQLGLPFNVPDFQIQPFQEQTYLFNPSFEKFLSNKELKMELWNCLKKMFL